MAIRPIADVLRRAAPGLAVSTLALQVASGLATTGALLATSQVMAALVMPGTNPERLRAAVPVLACMALAGALKLAFDAATAA